MKIKELAKLTGVTVRTLHYYDEIGLLHPGKVTEAGYRIYNEESLAALQQILFFRELGFSLSEIKKIMNNPDYNQAEALKKRKKLLLQKRSHIDQLIALVESTIKGDHIMSLEKFDYTEMETIKKKYANEVKERWGETDAYKESEKKTASYDANQWNIIHGKGEEILQKFGELRHTAPESEEVQQLVALWKQYITDSFYTCTNEILASLGQMYIGDERFTQNIDQNGDGTASFMSKAIEIYCTSRS